MICKNKVSQNQINYSYLPKKIMCGIVCALNVKKSSPKLRSEVLEMSKKLRHRGPKSNDSSFTIDKTDPFYGSGSLKVEKTAGVDVRMFTTSNCFFNIENNQSWNVSVYVKGDVGDKIDFSLLDGSNNNSAIGSKEYTIQYKGWHYVRLNLLSTGSTSQGKLRILFKNEATYWLDNIILNKGSFNKWYVDDDGSWRQV